jgi:hypothetical protein
MNVSCYSIDEGAGCHEQFQVAALRELLSDEEIETICRQLGHTWRNRVFPPGVTVRSMAYRGLHSDKSIAAILMDMAAGDSRLGRAPAASSWCQARSRLPEGLVPTLIGRSAERLEGVVGRQFRYRGRRVYIVDGSTISMPDTPELVDAFGYARTKHGLSRFPVARITLLTRAGVQAVFDYRLGPYRTSEAAQLHAMWRRLWPRSICMGDEYFGSFYNLAKLRQRDVGVVCRLHHRRDADKLIAKGRKIGAGEWMVPFELSPQLRKEYDDPSLPQELRVRLIRGPLGKKRTLWLVTTLLERPRYSRSSILRLYRDRWGIETRIGSLKTSLQMNVLRSKTVLGARHEVAATILAHNLVWTLIHQAAQQTRTPADRISFADAVRAILAFSSPLRVAPPTRRPAIYCSMLRNIARQRNPYRPGRTEPRLIKRDPKRYGFLKIPRQQAREECLS